MLLKVAMHPNFVPVWLSVSSRTLLLTLLTLDYGDVATFQVIIDLGGRYKLQLLLYL